MYVRRVSLKSRLWGYFTYFTGNSQNPARTLTGTRRRSAGCSSRQTRRGRPNRDRSTTTRTGTGTCCAVRRRRRAPQTVVARCRPQERVVPVEVDVVVVGAAVAGDTVGPGTGACSGADVAYGNIIMFVVVIICILIL